MSSKSKSASSLGLHDKKYKDATTQTVNNLSQSMSNSAYIIRYINCFFMFAFCPLICGFLYLYLKNHYSTNCHRSIDKISEACNAETAVNINKISTQIQNLRESVNSLDINIRCFSSFFFLVIFSFCSYKAICYCFDINRSPCSFSVSESKLHVHPDTTLNKR